MLDLLTQQPEDKIIKLIQEFKQDTRSTKIDLGVGVYRDRNGITPIMNAVKSAEKRLWELEKTKAYTGITGDPEYRDALVRLVLGDQAPSDRVSTAHTPGGTGAVRQALELIRLASPNTHVWISNPSWPNHISMTHHLELQQGTYRYFDQNTRDVDFDGMMEDLSEKSRGDIVILHGCCHNPTGANLNHQQWDELVQLMLDNELVPLIDLAYQGFGDGLTKDVYSVQLMAEKLPEMLIAASCSKNFGIYRERAGILIAIADTKSASAITQSNLFHLNRQNFSFPPDHGARLVTMVLNDHDLRRIWEQELEEIRQRMLNLRENLAEELRWRSGSDRFGFLASHRGMFSLLGASKEQVSKMRRDAGIYMVSDGRINIAGLNEDSIPVLAQAMLDVGL